MNYRNTRRTGLQAACVLAAALTLTACNRNSDNPASTSTTPESSSSIDAGGATQTPMTPAVPETGSAPGAGTPSGSSDPGSGGMGSSTGSVGGTSSTSP